MKTILIPITLATAILMTSGMYITDWTNNELIAVGITMAVLCLIILFI
jgi:hypothetical protein